ncbi:MFS transporter [Roseomonas sp. M0104]|uniref:MFS transporter n=1 Tax=Teichococcus coralli TaxID=2545983 RepID=A0A845BBK9_9PROT|nr:MFS transporter [Pseudoroseomonas coralli]MXP63530.1 MFS transporter [Pseudoroseomonas coralli]
MQSAPPKPGASPETAALAPPGAAASPARAQPVCARQPGWQAALGVTLAMQTAAAALGQTLPVVAPVMTDAVGLSPESIGYLAGLGSLGTALFLACGAPVLARLGPVRTLQAGLLLAAGSIGLAALGWPPVLLFASLLLGIGYGPTPPAGSRILAATAPPQHRTLIFSVKQAGAPLGAALAGLAGPVVALRLGWEAVCILGLLAGLAVATAVQPWRAALDTERDPRRAVGPGALFGRSNLAAPFAALRLHPLLMPLALLSGAFACLQGSLFAFVVTWLVGKHGLPLPEAGMIFAVMQGAGVTARLVLGWVADRSGRPSLVLAVQAFAGAGLAALFALAPVGTPAPLLGLLAAGTGFVAASWNGISLAEVARVAPAARISDATSGVTLIVFFCYFVAPISFAAGAAAWGWTLPLLLIAALPAAAGLCVVPRLLRG